MLKKLIYNDMRQNKLMSASTVFFMSISAVLLILTTMLFTNLLGAIDSLMLKAVVPDFIQMHAGKVDKTKLAQFVQSCPEVSDWQLCQFLNLDNSRLVLSEHNMIDSTQDNGLVIQNKKFDFLLGMDGELPEVSLGEIYVPICYRNKYSLTIGDEITIFNQSFIIAGFIRDAQMNSMMASSKRFLVTLADYEKLKNQGQEEYIIEFLLRDGADTNTFQTLYASQNLPSNGPTITQPLIRMINAMSDGMMIFVIFLVSVIVLLISILCVHFILSIQMERDRKEVGMLKSLGIGRKEIKQIYFTKYLLFSICGALIGLVIATVTQEPLTKQLRELYGTGERSAVLVALSLLAAFITEGIILLSVWYSLRKTDKLSALDALFKGQKKSRNWTQYILISAVTVACTFLMLVPKNLYNTIIDPSFVTYMGIGSGEFRIDIRQKSDIDDVTTQIATALEHDTQVESYTVLQTSSYIAVRQDENMVNLTVEVGDHTVFPVSYLEGTAPKADGEIALSMLNAKEWNLSIGDNLQLMLDGVETDYSICGIYSDITNGGKTAKISENKMQTPVIWSVLYVSLKQSANKRLWVEQYQTMGVDVVNIADYVRDTYSQTLTQLRLASWVVIGITVIVIVLVLLLFLRLIVERNRYTISLYKALGFTSAECEWTYFARGMLLSIIGVAIGLLLGCLCGERLCQIVLRSFGADGFQFVLNKSQVFAKMPLIILGAAAMAIWNGIMGIRSIKAYECCSGKE